MDRIIVTRVQTWEVETNPFEDPEVFIARAMATDPDTEDVYIEGDV